MSSSKIIGFLGVLAGLLAIAITVGMMNYELLGIRKMPREIGYESRIFDNTKVHTIDIEYDDWAGFISGCEDEMYIDIDATIDGEEFSNVALRAKGNTSLSSVKNAGSVRYSFKMEFDHFEGSSMYYGLDKVCLNNIIQDPSYMKDYLAYTMMKEFGVDAPLCSYVWISVNGQPWGLYLAVEAIEDSFMERNYGLDNGNMYKPDTLSMGAGPGQGQNFDMAAFLEEQGVDQEDIDVILGEATEEEEEAVAEKAEEQGGWNPFGGGGFSMFGGGDDVSLVYTDDKVSSYKNIVTSHKRGLRARDVANIITSLKKLNNRQDLEEVLDMDEVLRYFVAHNFTQNGDSYTGSMIHNYYLYIEESGKMHMIPWDYNLGYGSFSGGGFGGSGATSTINAPINAATMSSDNDTSKPMSNWIFADEKYTEMYDELYQEFITEVDILGILDNAYNLIKPYIDNDPTAFYTLAEFETGYQTIYDYCRLRIQSVQGQLDGTIASTNAEQRTNKGQQVDGSSVNISNLGGMNNMGSNDPDIDRESLLGEEANSGPGGGGFGGGPFGR